MIRQAWKRWLNGLIAFDHQNIPEIARVID